MPIVLCRNRSVTCDNDVCGFAKGMTTISEMKWETMCLGNTHTDSAVMIQCNVVDKKVIFDRLPEKDKMISIW